MATCKPCQAENLGNVLMFSRPQERPVRRVGGDSCERAIEATRPGETGRPINSVRLG